MNSLDLFRHTPLLFLLVLPAALLLWVWRRPSRGVVLPVDHAAAAAAPWMLFFVRLAESIPALLLALVVLLLAGPQAWETPKSQRVLTNIEFCVDVSGSMMSKFGDGDRYEAAMKAINEFLDVRKGDAYGLTFFGNNVLHWVPLTTDVSAFRCAPPFMHPRNLPEWMGGTEIGRALLACKKVLVEREAGDRMIVLITDGYSADLGGGRDEEVMRELRANNIVVYTLQVAETGLPDEVVRIAAGTGGESFKAEDPEGLKRVFARIDQMQKTRLEKKQAEAVDAFAPFCLAGLGLLLAGVAVLYGLRTTPW
jgi:Ca-activated chloride channel family protein